MSLTLGVRAATAADFPAVAAVLSAANPRHPVSVEELVASAERTRGHLKGLHLAQWVAARGPEVVGFAGVTQWAGRHHPDRYAATVAVHPDHTRRGAGAALAGALHTHLRARGAREVQAGAYEDEPHAVQFLAARGFVEVARTFDNVLTLAGAPDPGQGPLPPGYRAATLEDLCAEMGEDAALEAYRHTFNAARADEPRVTPAEPYTLGDLRGYLGRPGALPGGILLAVTGAGEVAALSELWRDPTDPARLNTGLTGVAPAHRRRGLALALKRAALEVARAAGAAQVWTQNDTTNAPMLALNARLGFRPCPAYLEFQWGRV